MRLEPLEERLVLSSTNSDILAGPKAAILDGLAGLVEWAEDFENHSLAGAVLPVIGESLGASLDLSEALETALVDKVEAFFTSDLTPTTDELVAELKALDGTYGNLTVSIDDSLVSGGLCSDAAGSELSFHLVFAATRALTTGLSLGPEGNQRGLNFDASGSVGLTVGLNFDVTFGFDLAAGLMPEDAFFIRVADLSASADASAMGLAGVGFNSGFFDATASGSLALSADLDVTVNNPDSDVKGNITLAELTETSLASLVSFTPSGSAAGSLTLSVSAFGGFVPILSPTISFSSTNPFEAPELTITDFSEMQPFSFVNSTSWLGMLSQIGNLFGEVGGSSALGTAVQLIASTSLGDVLKLDDGWIGGLVDKLVHPSGPAEGLPTFDSAQSFATAIESALGLTPGEIDATYDGTTHELSYHLLFDHTFAASSLPLGFDIDLDPLVNLSTSAQVGLDVEVTFEMTIGIDLDNFLAKLVATVAAPSDGKLSDDAEFSLSVALGAPVAVTVSKTSTDDNDDLDDLVADINAALATAGLGSSVVAGRDATDMSRLTLSTSIFGPIVSLQLFAAAGDPALAELKFENGQIAFDTGLAHLFVEGATLAGTATLTVPDIDATADFGYVSIGITDGSANAFFSAELSLQDPATQTPGGRVYLSELVSALVGDITGVVAAPQFTGFVNATLPIQATILGVTIPGNPMITISWPDVFTGSPDVQFENMEDLFNFEFLTDGRIFDSLGDFGAILALVQEFGLYDVRIPGLNKTLGELFDYAQQFLDLVEELRINPEGKLDELEATIETTIGLDDSALDLSLVENRTVVRIDITLGETFATQIPVNLDLDSLGLGELGNIIDIHGSALLDATAGVELQLDLGIDLSNPQSPKPFLYETTGLTLSALVAGTDVEFTTALGPIGIFIKNGILRIDGDGSAATAGDRAELELGLTDGDGMTSEGKIYLDMLDFDNVELTLAGQVHATLPVYFPLESTFQGNIVLAISDLGDIGGTTMLTSPDFDLDFDNFDLLNNLGVVLDGIDFVLGGVQDVLDGEVFGIELPLIGDSLSDAADFIEDIRTGALAALRARFQEAGNKTTEVVRQGLFDAFGPDGLDILGDRDGNSQITTADVGVMMVDRDMDGEQDDQFDFDLLLTKQIALVDEDIDFDIGLPGLGLAVEGSVEVGIGFTWKFGFGISREEGFYFDTSEQNELTVGLEARIPDLHAEGRLLFLQLDVSDEDADGNVGNDGLDADMDQKLPSSFVAGLIVDFHDPVDDPSTTADNDKLTFDDLASGGFDLDDIIDAELNGVADVNLDLVVSFDGDARFPSIGADLVIDWSFGDGNPNSPGGSPNIAGSPPAGNTPTVAFQNVRLNIGEFLSDYISPVLTNIRKVTQPLDPIVTFLKTPMPLLSNFGVNITPLQAARIMGFDSGADFIEAVANIVSLVNSVPAVSDTVSIPVGSFVPLSSAGMTPIDFRLPQSLSTAVPGITQAVDTEMQLAAASSQAKNFFDEMKSIGFSVPLLSNPASVFRLLMGQTVDLLLYDMPDLDLKFPFPIIKVGPIIPPIPIFFSLDGRIEAHLDLKFGFDSHGLDVFRETGDWWDVFSGFFISDTENADGTGKDVKEATLTAGLDASVELDIGVAAAGVGGGVEVNLFADFIDTNHNGKIHVDEFLDNIHQSVACTFDLGGDIRARLFAFVRILFKRFEFEIDEYVIDTFELTDDDCYPDRFDNNDGGPAPSPVPAGAPLPPVIAATDIGIGPGLHLEGLSLESAGDQDWYRFELLRADSIDVDVRHSHARANVDLEVYSDSLALLGRGETDNDREVVRLTNLPAGFYYARVFGDGELNNYKLAVEPGEESSTRVIYVSPADPDPADESNDAGRKETAYYAFDFGNDANDGLTARKPKASLQNVLDTYDLGPNDIVVFDTGSYLSAATILPADEGATYLGTVAGSVIGALTLDDADDNRFSMVRFGNAVTNVTLVNADNNLFERSAANGSVANFSLLGHATHNHWHFDEFSGAGDGILLGYGGTDDVQDNVIRHSNFTNAGTSIRITTLRHNLIHGNTFTGSGTVGIDIAPRVIATVTDNDVAGRGVGIYSDSTIVDLYGNRVHDNTIGMASRQGVIGPDKPPPVGTPGGKPSDLVFSNDTGVLIHEDSAGVILRFTEIYNNDVGIDARGDRSRIVANNVYGNGIGIRGSEVIGPESWETDLYNRVHDNNVGIETLRGAEARYNHVYLNVTGVKVTGDSHVHHNLIYRNTGHGALISGTDGINLDSNTIYAPGGNGIHLEGFLSDVRIRNNIVLAESGYAFYVSPESQLDPRTYLAAYDSDYNDYFATGGGKVAFQGKDFVDLFDWQVEAESDLHSLGTTSIDLTRDDPLFVNVAADDYHVLSTSPTIDAGDPTSIFSQEPGPNGNRANLGAYGNTPQAAVSPASWLRITYPEFYVDLRSTVSHPINWETYNVDASVNLMIELVEEGVGTVRTISGSVPASAGTFSWTPSLLTGPGTPLANNATRRHRVRLTTLSGPALSDTSREPFAVVTFNPALTNTFYVDDASNTGDGWSVNIAGSNRNTGLLHVATGERYPKAAIRALVLSYPMGTNGVADNVWLDTGSYVHAVNLNLRRTPLSLDPRMNTVQAVSIWGPLNASDPPRIDRANPYPGAVAIDMADAPNMRLRDIEVLGSHIGVRARDNSDNLVGLQLILHDNAADGLAIEGGSDGADLNVLTVYNNGRHGIFVDSLLDHIRDVEVYDNGQTGIALRSVGAAVIENGPDVTKKNEIYCTGLAGRLCQARGIDIINPGAATAVIGNANLALALGNLVHHNAEEGIFASGNVLVTGNSVWENHVNGLRLDDGADATQNVVWLHDYGITARGSTSEILNNRVFNNDVTAIEASYESNVVNNVVYSNELHGIHGLDFSGVIDHNLVYSTGSNPVHIQGAGKGAQFTNNTVYERCVVNDTPPPHAGPTVLDVPWDWQTQIFPDFSFPFSAVPWGTARIEFGNPTDGQDGTFNLGSGGGHDALTPEPVPPGPLWTIPYVVTDLDMEPMSATPLGPMHVRLVQPSPGVLHVQNVGGSLSGDSQLTLFVEISFPQQGGLVLHSQPIIVGMNFGPSSGFGEFQALQMVLPIAQQSPSSPAELRNPLDPPEAPPWGRWQLFEGQSSPMNQQREQDRGEFCPEVGVLVSTSSRDVYFRNNIIYIEGDATPGIPVEDLAVDVEVRPDSIAGWDSDFNVLMTEHGSVGIFNGVRAVDIPAWQGVTGDDDFAINATLGEMWVDPDGLDEVLGGMNGFDDNFHVNSAYNYATSGALAPIVDDAPGGTGLPIYAPVSYTPGGRPQSPAIDQGDPDLVYWLEPDAAPSENGQLINAGTYGHTDQASSTAPEYVQVIYPLGTEDLAHGLTYEIRWRSHDDPAVPTVDIELRSGGALGAIEESIVFGASNTGSYLWTVPPIGPAGEGFFGVPDGEYVIVVRRDSSLMFGMDVVGSSRRTFTIGSTSSGPTILRATPEAVECETATTQFSTITLVFSDNMDATAAIAAANYTLQGGGPSGLLDDGDDEFFVPFVSYSSNGISADTSTVLIDFGGVVFSEGEYRLIADSPGLVSLSGIPLDGDADGVSGGSYVREFTVDQTPPTVSIVPVSPDPRNAAPTALNVIFSEPVTGFGLADVRLTLDGGRNLLDAGNSLITSSDGGVTWTVSNVSRLMEEEGIYEFSLTAANSQIRDLAGNPLAAGASDTWRMDTTPPTADILDVAPDPRSAAVTDVTIVFDEPVFDFTIASLALSRAGQPIALAAANNPTTSDNLTWTVPSLGSMTTAEGPYTLKTLTTGGLRDEAGNAPGFETRETWLVYTSAPSADILDVSPDPRNSAVASSTIVFDRPVLNVDLPDVRLTYQGGTIPLPAGATLTTHDNQFYTLGNLSTATGAEGDYELRVVAAGSGIVDLAGNAFVVDAFEAWLADLTLPLVTFFHGSPDPRNSPVDQVTIEFTEVVTGFDLGDLTLVVEGGPNLIPASPVDLSTTDGRTWTLGNLVAITAAEGEYQLSLVSSGSGITDAAGNALGAGASDSWVMDTTAPTVTIVPVAPDPRATSVGGVSIVFSELVTGLDTGDLSLRRDGGADLLSGAQTLATTDNITFTLQDLGALTSPTGQYALSLGAFLSNIRDAAGNLLPAGAFDSWITDSIAPTVDILDVAPDPRSTAVDEISFTFSEAVTGVELADLSLTRDGGTNLLTTSQTLVTTDNVTYTLGNLASLTTAGGAYVLTLTAAGSGIVDGVGNALAADAGDSWTVDATPPTVDVVDIAPDPRATSVSDLSLVFSEPVVGFDLADLTLTRDGGANLLTTEQTLITTDNVSFTLGNLVGLTASAGSYVLTLAAAGSGIADAVGNALAADAGDSWTTDTTPPAVDIVDISPDPRATAADDISLVFSEAVMGFDLADLTLTRDGGANLLTAEQTLVTADNVTFTLGNLAGLTGTGGNYNLTLAAAGSSITDVVGNALAADASDSWTTDTTPLAVAIAPVAPDPRNSPVSEVTLQFTEAVSGFGISDVSLTLNGGANLLSAEQTLVTTDNITFTLGNLAGLTAAEGDYVVTLTAAGSGIADAAGNLLVVDASDSWTMDATPPTVSIAAVSPDPRTTPVETITFTILGVGFGFDPDDLCLVANGGPNLLTPAQTLSTTDNITFTLGNLAGITAAPGDYMLTLEAEGSGITDAAGNALVMDAAETWRTVRVGDFNADFFIGGLDLHILQTHLGMASGAGHFDGDMNGDGAVGRIDAALFALVYGQSSAPSPPAPAPEAARVVAGSPYARSIRRMSTDVRRTPRSAAVLSADAVDRVLASEPARAEPSVRAGLALRARRQAAHGAFPTSTTAR